MKSCTLTFGRFNPPTTGHEKLINKVIGLARGNEHRIYASQSQDAKKNPLTWESKTKWLMKMFPKANVQSDKAIKTIFNALTQLSETGYHDVTLVVGSDRVQTFINMVKPYLNTGKPDSLAFIKFEVVSAGERDPDADDISGMSASKLRLLASTGDVGGFMKGVPNTLSDNDKIALMTEIRTGMGLKPGQNI